MAARRGSAAAEVLPPAGMSNASELIGAGAQLVQIRTEKQLMLALQRPRDEKVFEKKLRAEAAAAGEDFYYALPFKKHERGCDRRKGCKCPTEYVEGPGVGLARSAARLWGNCSVETMLEQDTEDAWLVRTDFVDFETNYTKTESKRVSKFKNVGGKMYRARANELDSIYQAGASKVERDCIIRSLPKHIIDRCWELARAAAAQEKAPVKDQVARLLRRFSEVNVSLGQIEEYLGHPFTPDGLKDRDRTPKETCARLRGLLTAIRSGDVDVSDVFGSGRPAEKAKPAKAEGSPGDLTVDDILGAKAKSEPAPDAKKVQVAAGPVGGVEEGETEDQKVFFRIKLGDHEYLTKNKAHGERARSAFEMDQEIKIAWKPGPGEARTVHDLAAAEAS